MGIDDRDDYRSRGQAARRRGSYESSEPPAGRSQYRGGRDDAPRGRPRGADDPYASRSSGRRDYGRDDDPRASSGSRYQRGYDGSGGYDRRPRPDQSGAARRRPPDDYTRGERTARGPRPPMREYTDASMRSRGAPRGAGESGARGRQGAAIAQQRGGLWADEPLRATGLRPGMAGARDPRAARRDEAAEEEESSKAAAVGKALMAIILALLVGAGAAYGYYMYSTPKPPANVAQPSTTPASGAGGSTGVLGVSVAHTSPAAAQPVARVLRVAGAASWSE